MEMRKTELKSFSYSARSTNISQSSNWFIIDYKRNAYNQIPSEKVNILRITKHNGEAGKFKLFNLSIL